jgi:hypothetical protein
MALPQRVRRRKDPIFLKVVKGALVPASTHDQALLRTRKYHVGDTLKADLTKPRNPRHHRLVMALLQLVLNNTETVQTIDQLLTVLKIKMGRAQPFTDEVDGKVYWVLESISYEAMDQGEFSIFWDDLRALVARDYLHGMTPADIDEACEMMDPTE